jgi:hypothetical protein
MRRFTRAKWIALGVVVLVAAVLGANVMMARGSVAGLKVGPQRCSGDILGLESGKAEECRRLATFAQELLDQASHAPVASVSVYNPPPTDPNILNTYGGYADFAIVSFKLSNDTEQAFYVRCGVGIAKNLCFDLRPLLPGETADQEASHPNPVVVP